MPETLDRGASKGSKKGSKRSSRKQSRKQRPPGQGRAHFDPVEDAADEESGFVALGGRVNVSHERSSFPRPASPVVVKLGGASGFKLFLGGTLLMLLVYMWSLEDETSAQATDKPHGFWPSPPPPVSLAALTTAGAARPSGEAARSDGAGAPSPEAPQLGPRAEGTRAHEAPSLASTTSTGVTSGSAAAKSAPPADGLTSAQCRAMIRDETHIFRRMWAASAWAKMSKSSSSSRHPACWAVNRETLNSEMQPMSSETFFTETLAGTHCNTNWYEGNVGDLGKAGRLPSYARPAAPALFGFDETIDEFCADNIGGWEVATSLDHATRCVEASHNILSLYGAPRLGPVSARFASAPVPVDRTRRRLAQIASALLNQPRSLIVTRRTPCPVHYRQATACRTTSAATWSGLSAPRRDCSRGRAGLS